MAYKLSGFRDELVVDSLRALDVLGPLAVVMRCRREQEIYGQDAPADCAYRVVAGMARRLALQPNGRRRIVDFLLPGDFFGFTTRDRHFFAAEVVIANTVLARYDRRELERLCDSDCLAGRAIRAATTQEISRLQARILMLGRVTALGKVGGFLLEMANHTARDHTDPILLPMSRYDIADYLALSVETVSRAMTALKHRGAIALTGTREVRILDPTVLDELDDGDDIGRSSLLPAVAPVAGEAETPARKSFSRSGDAQHPAAGADGGASRRH